MTLKIGMSEIDFFIYRLSDTHRSTVQFHCQSVGQTPDCSGVRKLKGEKASLTLITVVIYV